MTTTVAESLSIVLLIGVLAFAVVRPRGLPEAVAAVPAALLVVAIGALSRHDAVEELDRLAPVTLFLAAVLVISEMCDRDGLFRAAGSIMAHRSQGQPTRLLTLVFILASVITAVLSLDATVVLLTPVVFATAARLGVKPRPHVYACAHLSNAGSLLLPVSNLTNLLALSAAGLTFMKFAGLMALPWLAAIAVEYVAFRIYFRGDLSVAAGGDAVVEQPEPLPRFSLAVLGLTLIGFVACSALGIEAAWAALAGALVLVVRSLLRRTTGWREVLEAGNIPFLLFVPSLGIVVTAVVHNGLSDAVGHFVPAGHSLWSLLLWAFLAGLLANLVNNLPAVLVLLPLAAAAGTGPILAVLIGVNVGPNLTFVGSLATLLWRRIVHAHDHAAPVAEFTVLGVLATPLAMIAATVALYLGLTVLGG